MKIFLRMCFAFSLLAESALAAWAPDSTPLDSFIQGDFTFLPDPYIGMRADNNDSANYIFIRRDFSLSAHGMNVFEAGQLSTGQTSAGGGSSSYCVMDAEHRNGRGLMLRRGDRLVIQTMMIDKDDDPRHDDRLNRRFALRLTSSAGIGYTLGCYRGLGIWDELTRSTPLPPVTVGEVRAILGWNRILFHHQ